MSDPGATTGARILDGKELASDIHAETAAMLGKVAEVRGFVPEVRVLLCGEDPASSVYAGRIVRTAERVGSSGSIIELDGASDAAAVRAHLEEFSRDPKVGGVIVQLPLPDGLDATHIIQALDPARDLDGIHPLNAGLVARGENGFVPSCAEAALQILKRSDIPIAGRPAVVIGRSNVVGKPVELLLIGEHATVTVCHRQTRDLASEIRRAEIVVVAAGSPGLVRGDMIRPGAVVIDCGINVDVDGHVVGDVDLDSVQPIASAVTTVPGGVGPVTNAVLMNHLARAARAQLAGEAGATISEDA